MLFLARMLTSKLFFKKERSKGALLIEVILTLSVLSVGLVLIIHSLISSLRAMVYTSGYSLAGLLAEDKMYTLLQEGSIKEGLSDSGDFPEPYGDYHYELKTERIEEDSEQEEFFNEVELKVIWSTGKKEREIIVTTYMTNEKEDE